MIDTMPLRDRADLIQRAVIVATPWRSHTPTLRTRRLTFGSGIVVEIAGEIDSFSATELESELTDATRDCAESVVLDLGGVTFFGAAGTHVIDHLVASLADGAGGPGRLSLLRPSYMTRKVLLLCGLGELLPAT